MWSSRYVPSSLARWDLRAWRRRGVWNPVPPGAEWRRPARRPCPTAARPRWPAGGRHSAGSRPAIRREMKARHVNMRQKVNISRTLAFQSHCVHLIKHYPYQTDVSKASTGRSKNLYRQKPLGVVGDSHSSRSNDITRALALLQRFYSPCVSASTQG